MTEVLDWLLTSGEPWTRYRTLVDLLERPEDDAEVRAAHAGMVAHPHVQALVASAAAWEQSPIRRHNDAGQPLQQLAVLADFGLRATDAPLAPELEAMLARQTAEGVFQSLINVPAAFGGSGTDQWAWIACDAPLVLYVLAGMGLAGDARVERAAGHLARLAADRGWPCTAAPELGRFHGPGRKADPCPLANLLALRALAHFPAWADSHAVRSGAEMLLEHWKHRAERRFYLFGMGTDFRKIKYPFVWYDVLHVADVLSRFAFAHEDAAFGDMLRALDDQADEKGRVTATSMYRAWKGWSFADKKEPSPWLTLLVLRIRRRCRR
jgi:hypothetical protein